MRDREGKESEIDRGRETVCCSANVYLQLWNDLKLVLELSDQAGALLRVLFYLPDSLRTDSQRLVTPYNHNDSVIDRVITCQRIIQSTTIV